MSSIIKVIQIRKDYNYLCPLQNAQNDDARDTILSLTQEPSGIGRIYLRSYSISSAGRDARSSLLGAVPLVLSPHWDAAIVPCYNRVRIFSCRGPNLHTVGFGIGMQPLLLSLLQFVSGLKFSLRESKIKNLLSFLLNCHVPLFVRSFSRKAKQWQWQLHTLIYTQKKGIVRYIVHNEVDRWYH